MPAMGPIRRKELLRYFRQLDYRGPYSGSKHQFMVKGQLRVRIPNPHKGDIGINLLKQVLKEAGIDRATWEKL